MEIKNINEARRWSPDKMQKVGLFATARMFCDVYCLAAGQAQAPHSHAEADKVYIVLEGQGRFQVDDRQEELGPGQAVLVPAGAEHGIHNPGPEPLVALVFLAGEYRQK